MRLFLLGFVSCLSFGTARHASACFKFAHEFSTFSVQAMTKYTMSKYVWMDRCKIDYHFKDPEKTRSTARRTRLAYKKRGDETPVLEILVKQWLFFWGQKVFTDSDTDDDDTLIHID